MTPKARDLILAGLFVRAVLYTLHFPSGRPWQPPCGGALKTE